MNIVIHTDALAEVKRLAAEELGARAAAIAGACNAESSWGGYFSELDLGNPDFPVARVWSADDRGDESRDQRILRFLDAGR